MVLPNLIIAGAPRSGTSTLFSWLSDHPQVGGSSVKEAAYFVGKESHLYKSHSNFLNQGLKGYEKYFRDIKNKNKLKWIIEATPAYIYSNDALQNLAYLPTKPVFIFMLREPSEQIYSTYNYFSNNWQYLSGNISFKDFINSVKNNPETLGENELLRDALKNASYAGYISKWIEKYGRDRVYCYVFDDLKNNPSEFMKKVCKDLGIDENFYGGYSFPVVNKAHQIRFRFLQRLNIFMYVRLPRNKLYQWIKKIYRVINTKVGDVEIGVEEKELLAEIKSIYYDDNRKLEKMLGIDLSGWT